MKLQQIIDDKLVIDLKESEDTELITEIQTKLKGLKLLTKKDVDGIVGPITLGAWKTFKVAIDQGAEAYITKIGGGSAKVLLERKEPIGGGGDLKKLVSIDRVAKLFNRRPTTKQYNDLIACLEKFHITTIPRICHFMAQVGHESAGLRYVKELASGKAYEGRRDLGNHHGKGYGMKYKGGGVIQLTGYYNYKRFSEYIGDSKVIEIGVNYVAENYPFSSAGFWWMNAGMNSRIDQGWTVRQISRRVNGGYNGLQDRINYYNKAVKIFK